MTWLETIKEIKEAQENNRLVIFVGSGVSKNSNIPTWQELINTFAAKIKYRREDLIKKQEESSMVEEMDEKNFAQDELLRIPEYFYLMDHSNGHGEYYGLIRETLHCENGSNPIDDEIFNIMPHHIITTNFDSLLEDSPALNSNFYTVVSKDSDLLSNATDRYLVKMHGDLKDEESLVLKESDYIVYEQKHPLISTFIKALLVNHTFLFLGYSLNDYNLNLIIGWINFFCEANSISDRPRNFMITEKEPSEYERLRLENKDIFVVSLNSMPDKLVTEIADSTKLEALAGKKLFAFLRCISDSKILQQNLPLEEVLLESCKLLRSYSFISLGDLKQLHPFERVEFVGQTLVFYDQNLYDQLEALLEQQDASQEIKDVFKRTILKAVQYYRERKAFALEKKDEDIYFQLYLDNNYKELENKLASCEDAAIKIYYYHFIGKSILEIQPILAEEESQILKDDFIAILLHKMRSRLASLTFADRQIQKTKEIRELFEMIPLKYQHVIGHLKMMFGSDAGDKHKMNEIVERQEEKYKYNSNSYYSEHNYKCVWDIQSYAYNYYFFVKKNGLPVDYFKDLREYLYYYIKVILCSYAPTSFSEKNSGFFFPTQSLEHYLINEVDFDIFIKYIKPSDLRELIEKYTVSVLEVTDEVNVCQKYINLCNAFSEYLQTKWRDHIFNFNIVLCFIKLENDQKKTLFFAFVEMLEQLAVIKPNEICHLFDALYFLVMNFSLNNAESMEQKLLNILIEESVYLNIVQRYRDRFIKLLKKLSKSETKEIQDRLVSSLENVSDKKKKVEMIVLFRHLLPVRNNMDFLIQNMDCLSPENIFDLLVEEHIDYSERICQFFIDEIENEVHKRNQNSGGQQGFDRLTLLLELCMILKLVGFEMDLKLFEPYKKYSEHLQFMLEPDNFDFSIVDTSNYMWQNLIFDSKYTTYFKKHKLELFSDELKEIFARRVETKEQQKIVYGILLSEDELFEI